MKKLLLLAVFALGVVACDKNDLGDMDSMSINPIETAIADDPMAGLDIDGLVDRLVKFNSTPKGTPNTAKTGVAGTSYISFYAGLIDGNLFEIGFDDAQPAFCAPENSGLNFLTFFYASNGDTEIYIGEKAGTPIVTIDGLDFLYDLNVVDYGVKINGSTKVVTQASVSNNIFTF